MILAILAESALRSLLLGGVVWIGLKLLRVRNPHVHMTSWIIVLVASLSMPILMRWTTVTLSLQALPVPVSVPAPEDFWPAGAALPEPQLRLDPVMPAAAAVRHATFNWLGLATVVYAAVAGMLLFRLVIGVFLTWRLARAATPISESWTGGWRVRVSDLIGTPVTFASTVLLPSHYGDWDSYKRRAVLAHEGAHVANGDFYILLLASLNRAVFWFSPLAWWQLARLAELAEMISDARAIEVVEDKCSYAEILLDLVQAARRVPAGLEMARAGTVAARVERILAATTPPAHLDWHNRAWAVAAMLPLVIASAMSVAYSRPTGLGGAAGAPETAVAAMPEFVSFYSLGPNSIFAISRSSEALFGQLSGQRKVRLAAASDGSWSYAAPAGQITFAIDETRKSELTLTQKGRTMHAARIAELARRDVTVDAQTLDSYVGWYELTSSRVLAVTRDSGRLFVEESGRPKFEVSARGVDAFSADNGQLMIFLRNDQGKVKQVLLDEPAFGAGLARWVSPERAKAVQEVFARRMADVPDRFKDQVPQAGSKESILRGIADLQRGSPNYERMSPSLAAKIRRQAVELQAMMNAFGAVESIFFRGVGPGGYDIYGAKFARGFAEFRVLMAADGSRAEDVLFRPDGNETQGGIAACSGEAGLKASDDATPIKLFIYNGTGGELHLYRLGADGKRLAQGTISEDVSFPILTFVGNPVIVADRSDKCLEIVVPGQQTRYHTIGENRADGELERAVSLRTAPQPGSETKLRQYIEALARGEPDYDRMTSDVAAQTRQQLPFNQAILARLGALRSVTFRAVSAMGSDVYIAHFANGSAEWRIALVKDGTIGRIALGPQY
jgi:beta-lactamase regulating signal transducer with metallopeptidase domain